MEFDLPVSYEEISRQVREQLPVYWDDEYGCVQIRVDFRVERKENQSPRVTTYAFIENEGEVGGKVILSEKGDGSSYIQIEPNYENPWRTFFRRVEDVMMHLIEKVSSGAGPIKPPEAEGEKPNMDNPISPEKKQGPTIRTQERFSLFKQIKDEHPDWTQWQVANAASEITGERYSADTVRNAYAAENVDWDRGDRTR